MSAFRVTRRTLYMVPRYATEVLLETDDGLEAEACCIEAQRKRKGEVWIEGTDPSHEWVDGLCIRCRAVDNGSWGSHLPCGFDVGGRSLVGIIADAARVSRDDGETP